MLVHDFNFLEITDVEQGHEGNTGHISSPFPSRERNGTPTSG